jgi:hypothetical protein
MGTLCDGRRTILPPRPTMARRLHALANTLWFAAVACLCACVAALGRCGARGLTIVRERWAPALEPAPTTSVPERRLSELLAGLRREPPLYVADASPTGATAARESASTTETVTRVG